jgi:hypothetical protein
MPAKVAEWTTASIDPGSLIYQIQIQAKSSNSDGFGQPIGWATIWTCRASRDVFHKREVDITGEVIARVVYIFTIYYPGAAIKIAPGMQIILPMDSGPHYFHVQTVENVDAADMVLKLMALETNGPS